MMNLIRKDIKNAKFILWPALWLGIPLLLFLQFCSDQGDYQRIHWRTAYWVVFFFSSTALLYRSYAQEHRFQTFGLYLAMKTPRWQILFSQVIVHVAVLMALSFAYMALIFLFWSPVDLPWLRLIAVSALTSLALAPLGCLMGLMLQIEREFLFSIFFMPLSTPLVLSAYSLSNQWSWNWLSLTLSFLVLGGFLGSFLIEFFFDEII